MGPSFSASRPSEEAARERLSERTAFRTRGYCWPLDLLDGLGLLDDDDLDADFEV